MDNLQRTEVQISLIDWQGRKEFRAGFYKYDSAKSGSLKSRLAVPVQRIATA